MRHKRLRSVFACALLAVCFPTVGWSATGQLQIEVLSSAPEHVSGGSALVRVGPAP